MSARFFVLREGARKSDAEVATSLITRAELRTENDKTLERLSDTIGLRIDYSTMCSNESDET